jgi:hypothetical protein
MPNSTNTHESQLPPEVLAACTQRPLSLWPPAASDLAEIVGVRPPLGCPVFLRSISCAAIFANIEEKTDDRFINGKLSKDQYKYPRMPLWNTTIAKAHTQQPWLPT